jgi:RNA polymerase sigma factor (sigma-70 family)
MSASVGIRMPGAVRLGAGLAAAPGGTLPTAACSNSGSSSSSAAASSVGGTPSPAAVAVGSGLAITTKSGSAGAFLTDGSERGGLPVGEGRQGLRPFGCHGAQGDRHIGGRRRRLLTKMAMMATPAERLPDETLLAGLGAGDAELSVAFVRRFQGLVFGVALNVLRDRSVAEDVAQQAFERAWKHAQMFDGRQGTVRGWLTRITHNLAIDVLRGRTAAPMDPNDLSLLITSIADSPERITVANDSAAGLRRELRRLPPEQARAVAMAGIYGMTARQVAESEGIPVGTAKTRIRYGLQKLRTALLPEDADDE